MASIIKSTDYAQGARAATFNFDDMARHGEAYIKQMREEAAKILAEAQQQAERIRKQAEIDGLKAAQRQHQAQVEAEAAKRMEAVLPALRAAVGEIQTSKQGWLAHWERSGVRLASRIAERVLRRELAVRPDLPLALMRESLELATGGGRIRILLNPADVQSLGSQVQLVLKEMGRLAETEVTADERIERGGCRLEMRHGSIDQQLGAQLQRIEEELT